MTKRAVVVIAVASFLLGGGAGYATAARTRPDLAESMVEAQAGILECEAYARYRYGSYAVAKAALLKHVDFVNALAVWASDSRSSVLTLARALSYTRLALAAERAAVPDELPLYLGLARKQFLAEGENPSDDQLRELVTGLDRQWDEELAGGKP
jgi:hypothetical protein